MARSDPGCPPERQRPRSVSAAASRPPSTTSDSSSPSSSGGRHTPTTSRSSPTPRRRHGHGTRQRHSLDLTQHLRPTFVLSPLELPRSSAHLHPSPSSRPGSSTSLPNPLRSRDSSFPTPRSSRYSSNSISAMASGSGPGVYYGYDYEGGEDSDRPRRVVSSPQLARNHTRGRPRSDSASSSASLTATEENYARHLRTGAGAGLRGHGNAYSHNAAASSSSSRFPTGYPALWTFAAPGQPMPVPVSMSMPVSPTSPDSSEAAFTSPSEEDGEGSESGSGSGSGEGEGYEEREDDDLIFVGRSGGGPAAGPSSSSRTSSATSMSSHNHSHSRYGGHGAGAGAHLRNRRSGVNGRKKESDPMLRERVVTTARGQPCAGETETELDEVPVRLPTSRRVEPRPVVPLLIDIIVPFLFQVTRFLSIVPATFGMLYNLYHVFYPPPPPATITGGAGVVKLSSIDYVICALWAILTGFQCLFLTTGLLLRWKAYYTTPSTLIRLVALQCICWPATHLTLLFFDHRRRPVACWALIGTTTCLSRSVQLWVTSNLYMPVNSKNNSPTSTTNAGRRSREGVNSTINSNLNLDLTQLQLNGVVGGGGKMLRSEGKLGPRRWDWAEVIVKCALPAGVLYFVTAWGLILKNELEASVGIWR